MKSRADKLIEEKLSSLESLPEGYTPNLDAKWSIIQQTAMKKPVAYIKWIGIAASIIFLLGCFFTWKSLYRAEPQFVHETKPAEKIEVAGQPLIANNYVAAVSDKKTVFKRKSIRSINKPNQNSELTIPDKVIEVPASTVEVAPAIVENVTDSDQNLKQRYIEVDFRDEIARPVAQNDNSHKPVKISISFKDQSPATANSGEGSVVRIKQNF
jgi:hypothetical protein